MNITSFQLLNYLSLCLVLGFGLTVEAQTDKNLEKTAATVIKNMVSIRSDSAGISNLGYGLITGESETALFIVTTGSLVNRSLTRATGKPGVKIQLGDQLIEATVLNKWSNLNIALLEIPKPSTSTLEPLKVDPNPNHFAACLFPKNANETSLQPLEKAIFIQDSITFKLKSDLEKIEGVPVISEKGLVGVVINSNTNNLICINITKISNLLNGNGRFPFNSLLSNAIPSAKKTAPALKTKELYSSDGKSKVLPIILTSVGIAAGAYSYITYKQSQDLYQTYKYDRNPLSPTYTEFYREGYLDQANSKLLIAQACAAGSAISLTVGLITLLKKGDKTVTPRVSFISNSDLLSNNSKLQFYNFLPNGIAFSIPLRNSK